MQWALGECSELPEQQEYKACPHPLHPILVGFSSVHPMDSTEDRKAPAEAAWAF